MRCSRIVADDGRVVGYLCGPSPRRPRQARTPAPPEYAPGVVVTFDGCDHQRHLATTSARVEAETFLGRPVRCRECGTSRTVAGARRV